MTAGARKALVAGGLLAVAVAPDPGHLLVAALLAADDGVEQQRRAFATALRNAPEHPLVLWNAHRYCRQDSGAAFCGDELLERTLAVAGENGALWLRTAVRRYREGDADAALAALERAATAPEFETYWYEHVRLFARAITATGGPVTGDRWLEATGFAAALPERLYEILTVCRQTSEKSVSWRYACLRTGQRLEADSGTLLDGGIGLSLQVLAYEADGDAAALADAERRKQRLSDEFTALAVHGRELAAILANDPGLADDFIAVGEAEGERAGWLFLHDELVRLASLPDYTPCN